MQKDQPFGEDFDRDFITLTDEDGNTFEMELIDVIEHNDTFYHAFAPAEEDEQEDDEDALGILVMKSVEENNEEMLATIEDEGELQEVFAIFLQRFLDGAEEDAEEEELGEKQ